MSLKKLRYFNAFDWVSFTKEKALQVTNISDWLDFDTQEYLGKKVEVVIIQDQTDYGTDEPISNLYEKLVIKVPNADGIQIDDRVSVPEAQAVIYGKYQNELSVKAKKILTVKEGN